MFGYQILSLNKNLLKPHKENDLDQDFQLQIIKVMLLKFERFWNDGYTM